MNIGAIVTPNAKGQIVIPQKIRNSLGITAQTPLQIVLAGHSVILHPIAGVIRKGDFTNKAFAEILRHTAGTWGPASEKEKQAEKTRRSRELASARKRKNAW